MRRKQDVASIKHGRHLVMLHVSGKDYLRLFSGPANDLLNFIAKPARADQQKSHGGIGRQSGDGLRQSQDSMPWPKRTHKTCDGFILSNSQLATYGGAATRAEHFRVDTIWINN